MPIISGGGGGGGASAPTGWTQAGNPANVESNGGGLNVELAAGVPFFVTDLASGETIIQVIDGALLLNNTASNPYLSAGANNLDISLPSAAGRITLDDFNGNDVVKITDPNKLGLYNHSPAVQPSVTSGTVTPEQLALALQTYGALGGS